MILLLTTEIQKLVQQHVPDIRHVDIDRGQLEDPEAYESIIQPAVLVGIPKIAWSERTHQHQDGDMNFYTKTIIQLPNHTHLFPATQEIPTEFWQQNQNILYIEDAVHQAVTELDGIVRMASSYYNERTFFVIEHVYNVSVYYDRTPRYHKHLPANVPNITANLKLPIL